MNTAQLRLIHDDIQEIANNVGTAFNRLSGKRLLLTGASSYLTSYMADTVVWLNENQLQKPCHLLALVRSPIRSDSRLAHLQGRDDVTFIQQSVSESIDLEPPVEFIIHAASNASPKRYLAAPVDTMDANVVGTRQVLEMARTHNTERMLFFSSSEVYGDVPDTFYPTPETYKGSVDPTHPRACYAESKRFGETLCTTFWREYQVPVKIVRVFSVYGPGFSLSDGRVMADFIRSRIERTPINLLSDGLGVRAFCYMVDSITGFWQLLLSDQNGEVFNIGSDQTVTIRQLAQLFGKIETPELDVTFADETQSHLKGAPSRVCPDISKARNLLGFNPTIDLQEGITRSLRWYRAGLEQATT